MTMEVTLSPRNSSMPDGGPPSYHLQIYLFLHSIKSTSLISKITVICINTFSSSGCFDAKSSGAGSTIAKQLYRASFKNCAMPD